MTTPAQDEYFKRNATKPKNKQRWVVFSFSHPDFSETLNFVAIEDWRGVEFDLTKYTFEGVQYKPVSMAYTLPNESKSENGKATLTFPRAGTEVKKRLKEITLANRDKPIAASMRIYIDDYKDSPSWSFNGYVSKDFPRISKNDVSIQISSYNPNVLTSQPDKIITIERFPELRRS